MTAAPLLSIRPCTCGHVERIHGTRPGLTLPDDRCRACPCPTFTLDRQDTDQ